MGTNNVRIHGGNKLRTRTMGTYLAPITVSSGGDIVVFRRLDFSEASRSLTPEEIFYEEEEGGNL